jgi:osmotically-inducible protein OsmY
MDTRLATTASPWPDPAMAHETTSVDSRIVEGSMADGSRGDSRMVDSRVVQAIHEAFAVSGYRTMAQIQCVILDNTVVLSGVVSSYFLKQLAQEAVRRLNLNYGLRNDITVKRP